MKGGTCQLVDLETCDQFQSSLENEHTSTVTSADYCSEQAIFASCSDDNTVKIWDRRLNLLRDIVVDEPMRAMCFLNESGDLLVGLNTAVSIIRSVLQEDANEQVG